MSNSSNGNSGKASGGIGFFGVLQLILITLKLCKVITWSWWLVLLPIWIGVGLTAILIVIIVIATILRSEADDFIHLTMKMKNGRTKILENQGFRTCRFYFIKIYMEFDYYLSINVVF